MLSEVETEVEKTKFYFLSKEKIYLKYACTAQLKNKDK